MVNMVILAMAAIFFIFLCEYIFNVVDQLCVHRPQNLPSEIEVKYKIAECYTILKLDKDAISVLEGIPSRQRTPKVCFHTSLCVCVCVRACVRIYQAKRTHLWRSKTVVNEHLVELSFAADQHDAGESLQKGWSGALRCHQL